MNNYTKFDNLLNEISSFIDTHRNSKSHGTHELWSDIAPAFSLFKNLLELCPYSRNSQLVLFYVNDLATKIITTCMLLENLVEDEISHLSKEEFYMFLVEEKSKLEQMLTYLIDLVIADLSLEKYLDISQTIMLIFEAYIKLYDRNSKHLKEFDIVTEQKELSYDERQNQITKHEKTLEWIMANKKQVIFRHIYSKIITKVFDSYISVFNCNIIGNY